MAAVDGAVRGVGRRRRPERRVGDPEADLLVGHVAARLAVALGDVHARARGAPASRAARLGSAVPTPIAKIANIAAKTIHACRRASTIFPNMNTCAGRDQQDREHLEEVREARRVLERHGRVRVVEAAAVRPELLDRDLRRGRAARDRLLRALERRRRRVAVEGLRHALRDQDHREDHGERQQDVDERPVEVAPEVAELAARAAARARARPRRAPPSRPGGDEVLHRQPGHLGQVRHRVLAAVVLPVRVRDEAGRRVQRDVRRHAFQVVRVQEQVPLEALDHVEQPEERDAEDEHGLRVALPVLLAVAADEAEEAALEPRERQPLGRVDPRHPEAERVASATSATA